ncbi:DUF2834 domain-containing protein [Leptospira langatensis]|uniref:DUF2834 domain-containing protein n=1 Tax=Leptospira langatensis TaxID=2484983 RepID=A0A5F1ZMW6_9LEPT|nr:DUF2834 domain-containing protein [Leptospira langatensis]TGK05111.1 DUF2834 domain-containing protein [Leptospira langatensis]TGL38247.1 DUF2834 domain-containing protein [Leptospira langatensis]
MTKSAFQYIISFFGILFALSFVYFVVPPLLQDFDPIGAALGGFVNPFSTGYSLDIICTWFVFSTWVLYEAKTKGIRRGWIAILLGVVPGVATGMAFYLIIRMKQEKE